MSLSGRAAYAHGAYVKPTDASREFITLRARSRGVLVSSPHGELSFEEIKSLALTPEERETYLTSKSSSDGGT